MHRFFSSPTAAQLSERSKKLSLNFSIGCSMFLPCRICIKSAPPSGLTRPGFLGFWVFGFFWVFLGPFFKENLGFWVFGFFSSQNSTFKKFFPKKLDFFSIFFPNKI